MTFADVAFEAEYRAPRLSLAGLKLAVERVVPYWRGASWQVPVVIVLGLTAALAESAGMGLAVVLLSIMLSDRPAEADLGDGPVATLSRKAIELTGGDPSLVAALMVLLVLSRVAILTGYRFLNTYMQAGISNRVRRAVFGALVGMPLTALGRWNHGQVVTILDRHSWSFAQTTDHLSNMILNGLIAATLVVVLAFVSPWTAVVALVGFATVTVLSRGFEKFADEAGEMSAAAAQNVNGRAIRVLQAMRTIRSFGLEGRQVHEFDGDSESLRSACFRGDVIGAAVEPLNQIVFLVVLLAVIVLAVTIEGSAEIALVSLALLYRIRPYLSAFEEDRLNITTLQANMAVVHDFVSRAPPADAGGVAPPMDDIRVKSVSFRYPDKGIACLDGVSFDIPLGKWTQIVGASGAGKSTLIQILLRQLDPDSGEIVVGDVPLARISRKLWLSRMALAGQDVELFGSSLRENIVFARPDADDVDVRRTTALVGLDETIAELPDGLHTRIGDRGLLLSGGQRQRVGLARALLRDPNILILDEATSALDQDSERFILGNIADFMKGRTVLVVGHRLPTGLHVDNVVSLGRPNPQNADDATPPCGDRG